MRTHNGRLYVAHNLRGAFHAAHDAPLSDGRDRRDLGNGLAALGDTDWLASPLDPVQQREASCLESGRVDRFHIPIIL